MELPSGQQHTLRRGTAEAVVTEVGGALRRLVLGGVEVLDGFDEDRMCDGGRGQTLLPWPNRIEDGRWEWEGTTYQLALTEPARGNAIHGLTRWSSWDLVDQAADHVHLQHRLLPQPGWPFPLRSELHYALEPDGLTVTTTVTNTGGSACPVAAGAHPYLSAGGGLVDDCVLEVPGATVLPTDERGIPTGLDAVEGTALDFRIGRAVGDQVLDIAYTDVVLGDDGTGVVRLTRPDGVVVELWASERYRYLQVFTGDTLAPARRRRGIAIEPTTAPPNALRTGTDLEVLQPGQALDLTWGIRIR